MYARWGSFAVGLALMLAPLALGYRSVAPILHEVAMGLLACIATLAALEWPLARLAIAAPGLWLVLAPAPPERAAAVAEHVAGLLLLLLAAAPGARSARRGSPAATAPPERDRPARGRRATPA